MLARQGLVHSALQRVTVDATGFGPSGELPKLELGLPQGDGDSALLAPKKLLALDHDERAGQFSDLLY